MSGTRPDGDDPTGCRGGRSCSGSAARGGRRRSRSSRRGVEVRRGRPVGRRRRGQARRGGRRSSSRIGGGVPAGGCRARREEPRGAGRVAARRGGACARDPDLERGRARLPAAPRQPADRRHRHERQDDDDRAARRDPPRRGPAGRGRRQRRPRAHRRRASRSSPARPSSASSRASSSRTCTTLACDVAVLLNLEPDHLDRHGTFEAYRDAKLRIFERARAKVVPRGLGLDGIEFAADDPLPAEPRIPGAHNRENAAAATAAARAAGVGDDAIAEGAAHASPACRTGSSSCASCDGVRYVNDSKATNTAAARRGVAAYDAPLRLILGGSLKGEDFAPVRARAARERPLDLSDRRGGRRARRGARRGGPRRTRATATSRTRSRTRAPTPSPATSCCSRRRPRASTSSTTSSSAATRSARLVEELA